MYPKTWLTAILFMAIPVALLLVGFIAGMEVESAAASNEKLKLQADHIEALDKAHEDYKTKLEEQRKLNEEVISEYIDEKSEIERKYRELSRAGGLRLPRSVCDPAPVPATTPGEPGVVEADAATIVLPERTTEDLRRLVEQADEVTAQCRALIAQVAE
jgi:hypothetical protein